MTTKELENKLKISENTCIHCPTLELAKQVLSIFHQLGLEWCSGKHYTLNSHWDTFKKNTIYYPFEGEFSSLGFAHLQGYKIISAEEFIALHTVKEKFDLESYEPKGDLKGFPKEIIARMLECQEEQGNPRDISVFEERISVEYTYKGFDWDRTKEAVLFWIKVIKERNFDLFFERYPKKDNQDNSQDFKLGDKVYDIMCKSSGIITNVSIGRIECPLTVNLENGKINTYTIDGRVNSYYETPQLLHYRDDYDYSIIDFNNLPKRQEHKRWRAEEEGVYSFVWFDNECWFFPKDTEDDYDNSFNNNNYYSGNYFRTKVEAEIIAQKLNTYFKQLIKEEHEHKKH